MANRGLEELEFAQHEVARAIRSLAAGFDQAAAPARGARTQAVGERPATSGRERPGTDLAERLLERLRRPGQEIGRSGAGAAGAEELPIGRLTGGERRFADQEAAGRMAGVGTNADAFAGKASGVPLENAFEPVTRAVRELTTAVGGNTRAIGENSSELASGLRAVLGGFLQPEGRGGGFGSFLKGGLGVAPLALQIAGLFRKKKEDTEPPRLFDLPAPIAIEAANSDGPVSEMRRTDRDQFGRVRAESSGLRREPAPAQQPQVIVNVSAMDSQSFMDRSTDIARALRDAMLHMHPVNDVIGEI